MSRAAMKVAQGPSRMVRRHCILPTVRFERSAKYLNGVFRNKPARPESCPDFEHQGLRTRTRNSEAGYSSQIAADTACKSCTQRASHHVHLLKLPLRCELQQGEQADADAFAAHAEGSAAPRSQRPGRGGRRQRDAAGRQFGSLPGLRGAPNRGSRQNGTYVTNTGACPGASTA